MIRTSQAPARPRAELDRAGSGHLRSAADGVMARLARLLIRTFFSQVQVEHGDRIESGRPTVLVANHRNGLVDGLLLMAALGRYPRFLGKSTLFRIPVLWPFLKLAGVVPVYRAQDGAPTSRNSGAFAMSNRLLAQGGLVAIFPEGISHDQPGLQPLRTGAARIALGATANGIDHVETVAVALVYDEKQKFRSRALVRVDTPRSIEPWMDGFGTDDHRAVRLLTDDLATRLRDVGPDLDSWEEADELAAIAEIVERVESVLPRDVALSDRQKVVAVLSIGEDSPAGAARNHALRSAYEAYRRDLDLLGLTDAQVAANYGSGRLRWLLLWALVKVAVAAPFATMGTVVHVVPYGLVKRLSRIPGNEGMRSTIKLLGCFFSFILVYVTLGVLVGEAFGAPAGLLAATTAPACGYLTVRMTERIHRIGGALAGYRAVRRRGPLVASVLADRAAVVTAATAAMGTAHP